MRGMEASSTLQDENAAASTVAHSIVAGEHIKGKDGVHEACHRAGDAGHSVRAHVAEATD